MSAHNEQHDPASAVVKQNLTTQPAAAQEAAPWRDHDAAIDAKALSTATEIALMWGQDRSQFISRIQVAVIDAMRWVKGGLQPAAAQEAVLRIYAEGDMRVVTEWLDGSRDLPDGDHRLYAAPVTAVPVYDGMLPDELAPYSKEWYTLCERRFAVDKIKISGDLARAIVDAICQRQVSTPAAPGIDLAALRARVVSAVERITSGAASMRIPADMTDPDLVLGDVLCLLDSLGPQTDASAKGGSEAVRIKSNCPAPSWMFPEDGDVSTDWRAEAAAWLEAQAIEQENTNAAYPAHAMAYPSWGDRVHWLRMLSAKVMQAQASDAEVRP